MRVPGNSEPTDGAALEDIGIFFAVGSKPEYVVCPLRQQSGYVPRVNWIALIDNISTGQKRIGSNVLSKLGILFETFVNKSCF